MKKPWRRACVWLSLLMVPAVQAQFLYTTNNGTITITGYTGSSGAVVIPSEVNGLPVVSIGLEGFSYAGRVTNVTIPDSVTNLGYGAFIYSGLTSVAIGTNVTSIGGYAFQGCPNLTSVVVDCGSSGDYMFSSDYSLTRVTIGPNLTRIGAYAFNACTNLTHVTLGSNVTSIGNGAFAYAGLTNITIPDSVTNMGDYPFSSCASLASVTIGSGVTAIGGAAFDNSSSLASVTMGSGVSSIGEYAFAGCTNLTTVTIPGGVTNIGQYAFYACSGLTGVFFMGNAAGAGSGVFAGSGKAVVYYLPGTTGWGPTFAGLPTVLWNPRVQTSEASFGVRSNQFGFTITGSSNLVVVVEASTNLANPAWYPLATYTLSSGPAYFSDPQWTNYPCRYYRLRWP